MQIPLEFFAVITYITEYFNKDDTAMMKNLNDALKTLRSDGFKERMTIMMNIWLTHRQMEESDAVYKLFWDFHFRESSQAGVFR